MKDILEYSKQAPNDYPFVYQDTMERVFAEDLNKVLKEYQFMGAWPTTISAIELSASENDSIEEFSVTWRYEYFRVAGINF